MKKETLYFEKNGKNNTDAVIEVVKPAAVETGIRHVVLASTSGDTALRFRKALDSGISVIGVTYHAGWRGGDTIEIGPEKNAELEKEGIRVLMCSHALSGVSRSVSKKYGGPAWTELIADTLKLFGQGIKVAVEVAVMAADAGLVPTDADIIAVGGSGKGADAACILKSAHQNSFFDLRIRRILAMVSKG